MGYGHIGSQLSVLAEALGMSVIYYDVLNLMALGTARQVPTLDVLLSEADFVTLHVPELPETKNMISTEQLNQMKTGSYLINASRGTVVDIEALIKSMRSGKLAGAALDVYPNEPTASGDYFVNDLNSWAEDLRNLNNIILTPHIGGSTEEAQRAIGIEVGDALIRYINEGITIGSVNMPEVNIRSPTLDERECARVCKFKQTQGLCSRRFWLCIITITDNVLFQVVYVHQNVPGVLRKGRCIGSFDVQLTSSRF